MSENQFEKGRPGNGYQPKAGEGGTAPQPSPNHASGAKPVAGYTRGIRQAQAEMPETTLTDPRPENCRFRLQDIGKPYPRSGCGHCGRTIATGLGTSCQEQAAQTAAPDPAPEFVELNGYFWAIRNGEIEIVFTNGAGWQLHGQIETVIIDSLGPKIEPPPMRRTDIPPNK